MPHRIEVSPAAQRQLKKLDRSILVQVAARIDSLADDPRPSGCEKLSGYDSLYRVRVGDNRIVYAVKDELLLVIVVKVGSRAEIYQRIRDSDLDPESWFFIFDCFALRVYLIRVSRLYCFLPDIESKRGNIHSGIFWFCDYCL